MHVENVCQVQALWQRLAETLDKRNLHPQSAPVVSVLFALQRHLKEVCTSRICASHHSSAASTLSKAGQHLSSFHCPSGLTTPCAQISNAHQLPCHTQRIPNCRKGEDNAREEMYLEEVCFTPFQCSVDAVKSRTALVQLPLSIRTHQAVSA